jgi:glutamyl-tRNA synthetase
MTIITRFAPSPTGKLHIGNARIALLNFLYAKKHNGQFILRIDNTDKERSRKEFEDLIKVDLNWLGLKWDIEFDQDSRSDHYNVIKEKLILQGDLYPCYETPEELDIKRKSLLSRNLPPIYDRAALTLSQEKIEKYEQEGRKPHYRYKIKNSPIIWNDMIKGEVKYEGQHLSDPVLIREDGSMTYMLCSTIDDIDYKISHVIRGEDHITNTAIQIQLFEALGAVTPIFGHLGLIKTKDSKISKREGGFEIESLREKEGFEAIAISNFLSSAGSSKNTTLHRELELIINEFDLGVFSKNSTIFDIKDIEVINEKIISNLDYNGVKERLVQLVGVDVSENFWLAVRPNLKKLQEIKLWWNICYNFNNPLIEDKEYIVLSRKLLPEGDFDENSWKKWTDSIKNTTQRSGKNLFLPLRLALTGMEYGPELALLLPIIGREEVVRRLSI